MEYGDERLPTRFWEKVVVNDATGCWEWTASRLPAGYGRFSVNRHMTTAHRVSWAAANGEIPPGIEIDHICHNHPCVNPAHLRPVTHKQNQENKISVSGRSRFRGVQWNSHHGKWHAKLSHNNKTIYLGAFDDEEVAARVVAEKRLELYTHNDLDRRSSIGSPWAYA